MIWGWATEISLRIHPIPHIDQSSTKRLRATRDRACSPYLQT